jgi:hypothetical protein
MTVSASTTPPKPRLSPPVTRVRRLYRVTDSRYDDMRLIVTVHPL